MSHSQFHSTKLFILRHAWLNLWDKHMTTGRINQVTIFCFFLFLFFFAQRTCMWWSFAKKGKEKKPTLGDRTAEAHMLSNAFIWCYSFFLSFVTFEYCQRTYSRLYSQKEPNLRVPTVKKVYSLPVFRIPSATWHLNVDTYRARGRPRFLSPLWVLPKPFSLQHLVPLGWDA